MPTATALNSDPLVSSKFMASSEDNHQIGISSQNEKKHHPTCKQHETMNKLHYRRAVEEDHQDGNKNNSISIVDSRVEAPSPTDTGSNLSAKEEEAADNNEDNNKKTKLQNQQMRLLPRDFQLGRYDVWCGRGRQAKSAPGNLAYRQLVHDALERYSAASTKTEKGDIISGIIEIVRQRAHEDHIAQGRGQEETTTNQEEVMDTTSGSSDSNECHRLGGFVKIVDGRWYEVGDFWAREKTSQCFRDALASKYSSAAASKYRRRRQIWHHSPTSTTTGETPDPQVTTTTTNENQPSSPKRLKRSPSEEDVAGVLQHMASFNTAPTPVLSSSSSMSSTCSHSKTKKEKLPSLSASSTLPMIKPVVELTSYLPLTARRISTLSEASLATAGNQSLVLSGSPPLNVLRVCAVQALLRPPSESPWDATLRVIGQIESIALRQPVDLFVLPELSPLGYSEDTFARFLPITTENQVSYQLIDRAFAETARRLKVYICYGTIGWFRSQAENREDLTIRQVVVDRLGQQVAVYDKTHLCDYGVCAETRFFRPGPASRPVSFPVETASGGSFRLGLLICADMRYPELARQLTKEHLVDGIIQPAAFARDCSFRTWKSFRETRAVENSVYWIGVNYSGKNYGDSCIVPPWVDEAHEPITMGCEEGYIVGCLSRSSLDHARSTMPFYRNLLREETTGWQSSLPVDQRGLTKAI